MLQLRYAMTRFAGCTLAQYKLLALGIRVAFLSACVSDLRAL